MRQCAVGFDGAEGGLIAGSDGVVVEERHEVGVRLAVADHPIELRQGADAGRFGFAELAVVCHQIFCCAIAMARCFISSSSKLKQVAPCCRLRPAAEIKAMFGQM